MGTRSRVGLEGNTQFGGIANLVTTIRRATEALLPTSREGMPFDMFSLNCLPFEASRTYKTMMAESDCRRAQTIAEVQRSLCHV
jgi:hypothetical protein